MKLTPFDDAHLPELMSWFPDELSCHTWGGPEFRFPFTEATFRTRAAAVKHERAIQFFKRQ